MTVANKLKLHLSGLLVGGYCCMRSAARVAVLSTLASMPSIQAEAATPSNAVPGYFNFDIHPTGSGGDANQIVFGSARVVDGPIGGVYNIAIDEAAYNGNKSFFSGFMVFNSFVTDISSNNGSTITYGATNVPITNMGLGCINGTNCDASTKNDDSQAYALQLGFNSTNDKGWYINNAAFGFTTANGQSYWIEGASLSSDLDVHAANRQTDGYYNSNTSGTNTRLANNLKSECMTPVNNDYCIALTQSQVNPEINGATLPKAALLLVALYFLSRRARFASAEQ
jgi:hypothetical protein